MARPEDSPIWSKEDRKKTDRKNPDFNLRSRRIKFAERPALSPREEVMENIKGCFKETFLQLQYEGSGEFDEKVDMFQAMCNYNPSSLRAQASRRGWSKDEIFRELINDMRSRFGSDDSLYRGYCERFWKALYQEKKPR